MLLMVELYLQLMIAWAESAIEGNRSPAAIWNLQVNTFSNVPLASIGGRASRKYIVCFCKTGFSRETARRNWLFTDQPEQKVFLEPNKIRNRRGCAGSPSSLWCKEMVTIFFYENDDDGGDTVVDDVDRVGHRPGKIVSPRDIPPIPFFRQLIILHSFRRRWICYSGKS